MTSERIWTAMAMMAACIGCGLPLTACMETAGPQTNKVTFGSGGTSLSKADYAKPMAGASASTPPPPSSSSAMMAAAGRSPAAGSYAPAGTGSGGVGGRMSAAGRSAAGAGGAGLLAPPGTAVAENPAQPAGPTDGTLAITVTPLDMRGVYSPANCGAVWVETMSGDFVKTTEHWCGFRSYYLRRWTKASGGWGSGFGRGGFGQPAMMPMAAAGNDQTDAVASATLRAYNEHKSTWKLRNVKGDLAPDGDYRVVIEVSEGPGQGGDSTSKEFPFTKGAAPATLMPPDVTPLKGVVLDYQPHAGP